MDSAPSHDRYRKVLVMESYVDREYHHRRASNDTDQSCVRSRRTGSRSLTPPNLRSLDGGRLTLHSHLSIRHNVWRYNEAPAQGLSTTYGSRVLDEGLHEIHASLHDDSAETDHPYAFVG